MNYTKEVLYHFLITGVIAGVVISILLSQTQNNVTSVNFEVSVTANVSDDLLVLVYTIYNTGDTVIENITTILQCCSYDVINTDIITPNDSTSVTEYLSINGEQYSNGDIIVVEFLITDNLGNSKSMVQSVKLG